MPTVADAAGLSAMAIQRRANLERRSISSRKNSKREDDGQEDDERLAVGGVAADPEAEEVQGLVEVALFDLADHRRVAEQDAVGQLREGHGGQGHVEALQPQHGHGDGHAQRGADEHHPDQTERPSVLASDVGVHGRAEPGDGEVGEAHLAGPADQGDEGQHDQPGDHEAGAPAEPDRRALAEVGAGEPRDPPVGPGRHHPDHHEGPEGRLPRLGQPLGPAGQMRASGLQPGLGQEQDGDEQDDGGNGVVGVGVVLGEGQELRREGLDQADDHAARRTPREGSSSGR